MPAPIVLAVSNEREQIAVEQGLMGERDLQIAAAVSRPDELEQAIAQHNPIVVIVSANFAGIATLSLVERLSVRVPLQIIVLLPSDDPSLVRRFVRAGAFDALPIDVLSKELASSVRDAIQRAHKLQASMVPTKRDIELGRIITLYGPKGGVGTSLLATNLAVVLAIKIPEPCIIVDLNLQFGTVDMLLNLQPETTIASLAQRFQRELDWEDLSPFLLTHPDSGLKVLAAPSRPELAELVTPFIIEKVLQVLKSHFAFIIIDTPSSLQDTTLTALDASDYIIIVTSLDLLAVRNTKLVLEMFQKLYPVERIKIVLNRSNVRFGGLSPEQVEDTLGMSILARIPSDGQVAVTSLNEGVPFVLSASNTALSQSLFQLAAAISGQSIAIPTGVAPAPLEGGVFSRVFRFLLGEE